MNFPTSGFLAQNPINRDAVKQGRAGEHRVEPSTIRPCYLTRLLTGMLAYGHDWLTAIAMKAV